MRQETWKEANKLTKRSHELYELWIGEDGVPPGSAFSRIQRFIGHVIDIDEQPIILRFLLRPRQIYRYLGHKPLPRYEYLLQDPSNHREYLFYSEEAVLEFLHESLYIDDDVPEIVHFWPM